MQTHAPPRELPFGLAEPRAFGGLTIVPLFPHAEPQVDYIGLDEAASRGFTVTEVDEDGVVEALRVHNPLGERVLLYEGEELVGAKQNRIVTWTALVEAGSKIGLPVHCVEHGRWSRPTADFSPSPNVAYPELRAARHRGGGQAQVWASVAAKAGRLDAHSPTGAQDAIYRDRRPVLDSYLQQLPRLDGQSGALIGIAGEIVCLDYVSRPDVFAGLYAKLLRGYALDAMERPEHRPLRKVAIQRFLRQIDRAAVQLVDPVGVGTSARYAGEVRGMELSAYGELITMTVFRA